MKATFTESTVEEGALGWLEAGGWPVAHGPDIAPDASPEERRESGEMVLAQRPRDVRSSPHLQEDLEAGT